MEIGRRGFLFGTIGAIIVPALIPVIRTAGIIEPISGRIPNKDRSNTEVRIAGIILGEPTSLPPSSLLKGLIPHSYVLRQEYDYSTYRTISGRSEIFSSGRSQMSFEATTLLNPYDIYANGHEMMLYLPGKDCILEYPCAITSMETSLHNWEV